MTTAARSLVEIVLQDGNGSVRPSKGLTFYGADGTTPMAQAIYTAVSGGSPVVSPAVDTEGTARYYGPTRGRYTVAPSDDPTDRIPVAFNPDPADVLVKGDAGFWLTSLAIGSDFAPATATNTNLDFRSPFSAWSTVSATAPIHASFHGVGMTAADVGWLAGATPYLFGALTGAIATPSSIGYSNVPHIAALVARANAGGGINTLGAYIEAKATAARNGKVNGAGPDTGRGYLEGLNIVAGDGNSGTAGVDNWAYTLGNGPGVIGLEIDINAFHADSIVWAYDATGLAPNAKTSAAAGTGYTWLGSVQVGVGTGGGTPPIASVAYQARTFANDLGGGDYPKWGAAFRAEQGAAWIGLELGSQSLLAAAHGSMPIMFHSWSGAVPYVGWILQNSAGAMLIRQGGGTDIVHFQGSSTDITAAGTTYLTVRQSGLLFTQNSQKIVAPMSSGTATERLLIQTSTAANDTYLGIAPTNTSASGIATLTLYNGTDITAASALDLQITSTLAVINSTKAGAGSFLPLQFATSGTARLQIQANGDLVPGTAALATNATGPFMYVESCAGTPTGVPTTYTGRVPVVFDTTGVKVWFYTGGAWKGVVVA